jgi:hypothetical protein
LHGWSERNAEERQYPCGHINHKGFISVYIEIHSSLDKTKNGTRLRIYGNKILINQLNHMLHKVFAVDKKTPQRATEKTYVLYFQSENEIAVFGDYYQNTGATLVIITFLFRKRYYVRPLKIFIVLLKIGQVRLDVEILKAVIPSPGNPNGGTAYQLTFLMNMFVNYLKSRSLQQDYAGCLV